MMMTDQWTPSKTDFFADLFFFLSRLIFEISRSDKSPPPIPKPLSFYLDLFIFHMKNPCLASKTHQKKSKNKAFSLYNAFSTQLGLAVNEEDGGVEEENEDVEVRR